MAEKKKKKPEGGAETKERLGVRTPDAFFPLGYVTRKEADGVALEKGGVVVKLKGNIPAEEMCTEHYG